MHSDHMDSDLQVVGADMRLGLHKLAWNKLPIEMDWVPVMMAAILVDH